MNTIRQTETFAQWLKELRDATAKMAILRRADRIAAGNFGDAKPVGDGVSELRIDVGPGYRVYYTVRRRTVVFLLCGGDKSSQSSDIATAKDLAKTLQVDGCMGVIMKTATRPFDVAEFLDDPEVIALYLSDAAADPDPDLFIVALSNVARAVGISSIAAKSGLGRESLYKSLAPGAQPRLDTVRRIASAFGLTLQFAPSATLKRKLRSKTGTKLKAAKKPVAKLKKSA